jgi:GH25 family lysozyme M1 (1,4-beta-N-acetylmuramidase)
MAPVPADPSSLLDPNYKVFGADTSFWSLELDFDKYKAAGATFVIIKALHGKNVDPYFIRNYSRARRAGVYVSSYQWLVPGSQLSIKDQVQAYAAVLQDYPHDFVPWLDYEAGSASPDASDFTAYVDLFRQTTGRDLGVYSAYGKLIEPKSAIPDRYASMKFWVANYSVSFPRIARPFTNWDFWQFTESMPAEAYGFPPDGERAMDMNYFNGSMETFLAFCFPSSGGTDEQQLERQIEWEVPKPTLVRGNTGIDVLKLQDLLVKFGFMTSAQLATGPGIFGPRTTASLINMQAALGLPTTGSYDDSTRAAVIAHYYSAQPPPIISPPPEPVSDQQPVEEKQMFNGRAVYKRYVAKLSRGDVQYHVIKVDLTDAQVLITPPPSGLSSVPAFLKRFNMDIAINGDGWSWTRARGLKRIQTAGENASRGKRYGVAGRESTFYLDKHNRVTLARPAPPNIWNALSFPNILVENGQVSRKITRTDIDPRTAVGFSQDGKYAILVAVDGVETAGTLTRSGMTFAEVANILVKHGAWVGANQDGGGSTTLVVRDEQDGQPRILNEPCGTESYASRGRTYRLRSVANHLGIRLTA